MSDSEVDGDRSKRKNSDGNIDGISTEKRPRFGARFLSVLGILTVILVVAVIHVAMRDERKSYFDELLSTGGAIRSARNADEKPEEVCQTAACHNVSSYIKSCIDTKVDPCDDFFEYVCRGWNKINPIPKTSATYSTFTKLNMEVEHILRDILASDISEKSGLHYKPKQFFQSCMHLKDIDKLGAKPVREFIDKIGGWSMIKGTVYNEEKWNLVDTLLNIHQKFTSAGGPLFSVHVSDDPINNTRHIVGIDQAGPSLSREVYFDNKKIIKSYKKYLAKITKLLGGDEKAEEYAEEIVQLETKLANISVPDADKTETWFNRMTLDQLEKEAPGFPWKEHVNKVFSPQVIKGDADIIVPALPYLQKVIKVINDTPKRILSNYVAWNVVQGHLLYLSKPFRDARKSYREEVLGSKGERARWKTCVSLSNQFLGDLLGTIYTRKNFDKEKKATAENMIKEVRQAFKDNVNELSWMDTITKTAVGEKADAMNDEVGYPDYLVDDKKFQKRFKYYHDLHLDSVNFYGNMIKMMEMMHQRMLKKLKKKVDKEEWPMDPQTINAMYSFNENEMIIPAGILQPPFFYARGSPMSLSFGAIGSILGHELTHGFDNTGRKFNKYGELTKQWWTQPSLDGFKTHSNCIEKQYSMYKVNGKWPLNGKLTLGENIADNGGFRNSYRAYKNWLKKTGKEMRLPNLDYTNEQLFFIGFGQAYCSNSRPNEKYLATLSDRHSEEKFRVIGTLSNSRQFSEAFKCAPGTKMNPVDKCEVWYDSKAHDIFKNHPSVQDLAGVQKDKKIAS